MVEVRCPNPDCQHVHPIASENLGMPIRCRQCGTEFTLEDTESTPKKGRSRATDTNSKATPPNSSETNQKVKRLGRFEIRSRLGAGAFGTVYRAYDPQLDREVALKVPHVVRLGNSTFVKRFLNEAKATARLQHPHIVPVFDAGRDGKRYFIASAFIAGGTLEKALRERNIDYHETARIIMQLAEALIYAHKQKIVHRDVKPDNIMLDLNDEPHLMDFGLARLQTDDEKLTQVGSILGTPAYMSPEQARGDLDEVGPASDQYSLGVTMYEMLCGGIPEPFHGPLNIVVYNVEHTEPPAPKTVRPDIPRDLETICQKAMAKESPERYQSCAELADDLRRWLADEPILARQIGLIERAQRWYRRNPIFAGFSAVLAGIVLLALALVTWQWRAANFERRSAFAAAARAHEAAKRERLAAESARQASDREHRIRVALQKEKEALAVSRDETQLQLERSGQLLYANQIKAAYSAWDIGDVRAVRQSLFSTDPDRRGWEYDYLLALLYRNHESIHACQKSYVSAFSMDGTLFASGSGHAYEAGVLSICSIDGARANTDFKGHKLGITSIAFSPEARRVATGSIDTTIRIWSLNDSSDSLTLKGHEDSIDCVTFSANGKYLASGGVDKSVRVWNAENGDQMLSLVGHRDRVTRVAFSPDGRYVASGDWDGVIRIWDIATAREIEKLNGGSRSIKCVEFSPDGQWMMSGSAEGLRIWNMETLEQRVAIGEQIGGVNDIAFSFDGKQFVVGGSKSVLTVWETDAARQLVTLKGHSDAVTAVVFDSGSQHLVSSAGGALLKWSLNGDQDCVTIRDECGVIERAAIDKDGGLIVSGCQDSSLKLWNAKDGRLIRTFSRAPGTVKSVAFSPDGKRIVVGSLGDTFRACDVASGKDVLSFKGHTDHVFAVSFSPDGSRIASGSKDSSVRLWDAASAIELNRFTGHERAVSCVSFSPDGRHLVSGSFDRTLKIWNVQRGEEENTLKGHSNAISAVAYSPDGKRIASGSQDATLRLWDSASGKQIRTFRGHTLRVMCVAFSPDGGRIVSGSADSTLKVWDTKAGYETMTIRGHNGDVSSVGFSEDGNLIFSASDDGTIKVWDATSPFHKNGEGE